MQLLVIDTATEACSVALCSNDTIVERYELAPRRHAELVLPMVNEILAETETTLNAIDAIAFGAGPGAFTGVRIAAGVVQGLAFAHDLPVIPISTLATMAQAHADQAEVIVSAIDARMQEVYICAYEVVDGQSVRALGVEIACPASTWQYPHDKPCLGVGSGWSTYREQLMEAHQGNVQAVIADYFPRAGDMLPLARAAYRNGDLQSAAEAIPSYVRNKVASPA